MATEVDRLVVVFDANFAALDAKLNKVLQKQQQAKKQIEDTWKDSSLGSGLEDAVKRMSSSANEIPVIGAALEALGPAGVVAAVGIGLVVGALESLEKAAAFGDEIFKSAAKIGASTQSLQEWRHVVDQAGGDAKDADAAIGSFTAQLGQAALGAPKALRAFQALKLDPKNMVGDTDKALSTVIDRLSQIGSVAERIGLAKKMGLDAMIPVLSMTADQIAATKKEAEDLGLVLSDETAVAAHELTDHFDELKLQIKNELTTALVNLGPVLLPLVDWFADVAKEVAVLASNITEAVTFMRGMIVVMGEFARDSGIQAFGDKIAGILNGLNKLASSGPHGTINWDATNATTHSIMEKGRAAEAPEKAAREAAEAAAKALRDRQNAAKKTFQPGSLAATKGGRDHTPKDATSEFDKQAADAYNSSLKELASAQAALATTITERAALEKAAVDAERDKKLADLQAQEQKIQKAVNDKKSKIVDANSKAQLEQLKQAEINVQQTAVDQKILIDRNTQAALLEQQIAHEQAVANLTANTLNARKDHLDVLASLATTAKERNALEQQALAQQQSAETVLADAKLKEAQEHLDAAKAIDAGSDATKAAQDALDAARQDSALLAGRQADARASLDLSQEGPVQKYQRSIQDLNTTMEEAAVGGAKSLADGLADAIVNAKSLGDLASNVFRQMAQQLISATIQKSITGPLLSKLFPAADDLAGLFATGTLSSPSGYAMVGEQGPEVVRLPGNSQVIPNAALRNIGLQGGGGAQGVTVTFDNRGAVIWEEAAKQMMSYADQAAARSGMGAAQLARRATPTDLSRQAGRRL